ncbi:hypothetical protein CYMTET_20706, partial [Cymbomonas tetramitiformis]
VGQMNERNVNITLVMNAMSQNLTMHENTTDVFGYVEALELEADAWIEQLSSSISSLPTELWKSFDQELEEKEAKEEDFDELEESAADGADGETKKKKKREPYKTLLPAMELANAAGFDPDEQSLELLQGWNQGTFNKDEDELEQELDLLLKLKGFDQQKIKKIKSKSKSSAIDADEELTEELEGDAAPAKKKGKLGKKKGKGKKAQVDLEESDIAEETEEEHLERLIRQRMRKQARRKEREAAKLAAGDVDAIDGATYSMTPMQQQHKKKKRRSTVDGADSDEAGTHSASEAGTGAGEEQDDGDNLLVKSKRKQRMKEADANEEKMEEKLKQIKEKQREKEKLMARGTASATSSQAGGSRSGSSEEDMVDTLVHGLVPDVDHILADEDEEQTDEEKARLTQLLNPKAPKKKEVEKKKESVGVKVEGGFDLKVPKASKQKKKAHPHLWISGDLGNEEFRRNTGFPEDEAKAQIKDEDEGQDGNGAGD